MEIELKPGPVHAVLPGPGIDVELARLSGRLRERLRRAAGEFDRFLTAWSITAPGIRLPESGLGGGPR